MTQWAGMGSRSNASKFIKKRMVEELEAYATMGRIDEGLKPLNKSQIKNFIKENDNLLKQHVNVMLDDIELDDKNGDDELLVDYPLDSFRDYIQDMFLKLSKYSPPKRKSPLKRKSPPKRKSPLKRKSPAKRKSPPKRKSPAKRKSPPKRKSPAKRKSPPKRKSPAKRKSPPKRKSPAKRCPPGCVKVKTNKTVDELKAIAKERGLKGYSKLRKEELVKLLKLGN